MMKFHIAIVFAISNLREIEEVLADRVNDSLEQRNECEDKNGIKSLHLIGQHHHAATARVHFNT